MFTGIVKTLGKVVATGRRGDELELRIDLAGLPEGQQIGDSIAVNGCCLTLEASEDSVGRFYLSSETLAKTWLASLKAGDLVNLEDAARFGEPIGGHLVQGHVDGVGRVISRKASGEGEVMEFEAPESLAKFLLPKGSIAVDGISLTIAESGGRQFSVALIPLTLEKTNLRSKKAGDPVNLEGDIVGKWIDRLRSFE